MAVASRPVPSTTEPVFVTSPVDEGSLLISSDAFSAGGGFDELAMPRLRAGHPVSQIIQSLYSTRTQRWPAGGRRPLGAVPLML